LELQGGNGALIATDDNWKIDQPTRIEATKTHGRLMASAIVADLLPALYAAAVAGKGTSGVA
jgi:hypothetical protein